MRITKISCAEHIEYQGDQLNYNFWIVYLDTSVKYVAGMLFLIILLFMSQFWTRV